jgi:hypothetical protein
LIALEKLQGIPMQLESIPIEWLVFDPNNARKHSQKNLDAIKGSLTKFGQQKPIVVDQKNVIIAGNGTVAAAKDLGWKEIKAVRSTLEGFMQSAFAIADNRTAELAEWDFDVLKESLNSLDMEGFDISGIGFTDADLDFIGENSAVGENGKNSEGGVDYTTKIAAPIYEPKGPKPRIGDMFDLTKFQALQEEINNSKLSEDEKEFLRYASARHIVFDYQSIAEYYAHSPAPVQDLMERSALVIIDFDKAIENGFVKMSKDLAEAYGENGNVDEE